ncbi:hypothetical protein VIGAN_02132400 [Vigna angularis var. angularis]|uniref:Uncharacterized protein n=1 Tax=Vigna angularis var. angularis TaxID=157739 RepID=A0A0S3RDY6_PHAAN|nr:hypothetical protein VIGAN_02132400 [Vigna angularis var. angularis]
MKLTYITVADFLRSNNHILFLEICVRYEIEVIGRCSVSIFFVVGDAIVGWGLNSLFTMIKAPITLKSISIYNTDIIKKLIKTHHE